MSTCTVRMLGAILIVLYASSAYGQSDSHASDHPSQVNFYTHTATDIHGNVVKLEKYRGKVTLVVNVASECGFTENHYRGLVRLQSLLEKTGHFTVLGFPCNQFGRQEPGNDDAIFRFAQTKYDVNFPMFSKINVIENNVHPAWQFLIAETNTAPNWNFYKYLVDYDGKVVNAWGPWTDVESITAEVKRAVTEALNAHGPPRPDLGPQEATHEPYMESGQYNADTPQPGGTAGSQTKEEREAPHRGHDDL